MKEARPTDRRWTFQRRVQLVQGLCHILGRAHAAGVVHGDVSPQNVVLDAHGQVSLVDWASAQGRRPGGDVEVVMVDAGVGFATPAYMAPERSLDTGATPASDVYSLCAVLFELLTLEHYLSESPANDALYRLAAGQAPKVAARCRDPLQGWVPRGLSRVVAAGLSRRASDRPSVAELEEALQRWLEGRAGVMRRAPLGTSAFDHRHPALLPALLGFMLAVVLGLIVALLYVAA